MCSHKIKFSYLTHYEYIPYLNFSQSGRIGKVVASHAEGVQGRFPPEAVAIYTMHEAIRRYCP